MCYKQSVESLQLHSDPQTFTFGMCSQQSVESWQHYRGLLPTRQWGHRSKKEHDYSPLPGIGMYLGFNYSPARGCVCLRPLLPSGLEASTTYVE